MKYFGNYLFKCNTVERMIMLLPDNGEVDWKGAIEETDKTLTSTEPQHLAKGNIVYDIERMIQRVHKFPSRYAKYQNIQATLKAFVLEHYLHGRPLLLNKEESPLVEASVGRILNFGEGTATVLVRDQMRQCMDINGKWQCYLAWHTFSRTKSYPRQI